VLTNQRVKQRDSPASSTVGMSGRRADNRGSSPYAHRPCIVAGTHLRQGNSMPCDHESDLATTRFLHGRAEAAAKGTNLNCVPVLLFGKTARRRSICPRPRSCPECRSGFPFSQATKILQVVGRMVFRATISRGDRSTSANASKSFAQIVIAARNIAAVVFIDG